MKKVLWAMLAVLCAACSGGNDEPDYNGEIQSGLYSYVGPLYIVTVGTDYKDGWSIESQCEPGYISIVQVGSGESVFTQRNGMTQIVAQSVEDGKRTAWKGWGYENGLRLVFAPKSKTTLRGVVQTPAPGIDLPDEMIFEKIK